MSTCTCRGFLARWRGSSCERCQYVFVKDKVSGLGVFASVKDAREVARLRISIEFVWEAYVPMRT